MSISSFNLIAFLISSEYRQRQVILNVTDTQVGIVFLLEAVEEEHLHNCQLLRREFLKRHFRILSFGGIGLKVHWILCNAVPKTPPPPVAPGLWC